MRAVPYAALLPPPSWFSWVLWAVNPDLWEERMRFLFSDRLWPWCSELPWAPGLLPANRSTDTFAFSVLLPRRGRLAGPHSRPAWHHGRPDPPSPGTLPAPTRHSQHSQEEDPGRSGPGCPW